MEVSSCYVYKNHIFAKSFHDKSYVTGYYSRNNDQKTGTRYIGMVQDVNNVLDKGWTHDNTKYVLILHPTDRSKTIELQQKVKNVKGANKYYSWYTEKLPSEFSDSTNYPLIVARKNNVD